MRLESSDRSLKLPPPSGRGVEVFVDRPPGPADGRLQVTWLRELPRPALLPELLRADQIWADPRLLGKLEAMGIPSFRLLPVTSLEEGQAAAGGLLEKDFDFVWRGGFGRNSSLQWVGSETVRKLQDMGRRVLLQSPKEAPVDLPLPAVSLSWPPDFIPASRGPLAVYAPWEYWYAPSEWVERGPLAVNRFLTCSDYAMRGMVDSGMARDWLRHIPVGVDSHAFSPEGGKLFEDQEGRVVFLFVGGTIYRKGVDLLQKAWELAFDPDDPVLLLIKDFGSASHYRGQNALQGLSAWANNPSIAPVRVISDHLSPEEMPLLYRSADVGVFPYRGEGFCMPALEAMASGLPIIFPDQGPTREYCQEGGWMVKTTPKRLSPPADISLVEPPLVHQVEVEALAEALRAALSDNERQKRGEAARQEAEEMSWDKAAKAIDDVVGEIGDETPVYNSSPVRPQGEEIIVSACLDWQDEAWAFDLAEFIGKAPPEWPLTLCLFAMDQGEAESRLVGALQRQGVDLESEMIDISLVQGEDFFSLALASDAVLLLPGDKPRPDLGRPQLGFRELLLQLEAKIGSDRADLAI